MSIRTISLAIAIAGSVAACQSAGEQTGSFVLSGEIKGLKDGKIYIGPLSQMTAGAKNIDSFEVKNGKFTYTTKVNEPAMYFATTDLQTGSPGFLIVAEKAKVTVKGQIGDKTQLTYKGSENQIALTDYTSLQRNMQLRQDSIFEIAARDTTKRDLAAKLYDEYEKQYHRSMKDIVLNNINTMTALFVLQDMQAPGMDYNEYWNLYKKLSREVRESQAGQKMGEQIARIEKLQIGQFAPNFSLPDVNGNEVDLNSLKGKYVLLDFWASWCGPCRAENPNVVKAFDHFKNKNFTILGISLDEKKDSWLNAIEKDQLSWTHVSDLKGWAGPVQHDLYQINGIPANFLLDPTGKIIGRDLHGEELEKELSLVLK